jgi:hypothetical protein
MKKIQKVKAVEPLPRRVSRIAYQGPISLPVVSTGTYLLAYLYQEAQPFLPMLATPLSYGGCWRGRNEYTEAEAEEEGILLLDRWRRRGDGYRVYLRDSGYALLFSEVFRGRGWGESLAQLRHLKPHEAVAALGGLRGVLPILLRLSREFAACTTHKKYGSEAGRLAWWCRAVVRDIRARGLV